MWQTWTLPLQRHGKVHLSKKKNSKGCLQTRLKCPKWPSPLPVLLELGDLERETNITCSYCWDQVLSLQVKASLVLLPWWDLPLWDKTRELKTGTPRAGISQPSVTVPGACCSGHYWYLTYPTCTKCPRRCCLTSPLTFSFPAPGTGNFLDCRFIFLSVPVSQSFQGQTSANPCFPAHLQWCETSTGSILPPGKFFSGNCPV